MSEGKAIGIVASGSARDTITFYAAKNVQTDYITVYDGDGNHLIYEILRLTVQNSRLTEPDIVRFMEEGDNYQRYNVYIGEAVPIACLDKKKRSFRNVYMIAPPGACVYPSTPKELSLVYNIAQCPGRQKIGTLLHQKKADIYLDLDKLLHDQVHLAVVGRTGSGKSWFVRHFLELLRMRSIVFSPTDEYDHSIAHSNVIGKGDVVLRLNGETAKRFFDLNPSERKFFESFLKNAMGDEVVSSEELAEQCAKYLRQSLTPRQKTIQMSLLGENDDIGDAPLPQYADTLCQKLENAGFKMQKLTNELRDGECSEVYNLQGCRRSEEEQIVYNTLYPILEQRKALFRSEGEALRPEDHIAIVLEEAQNYAPSTRSTLCRDILVDIARIGRKYGMHILLLSQRPRYIDQTILSQCGGGMFFNLPNPEDIDYVMNSASLNRSVPFKHMIQNFDTGECILLRAEKNAMDLLCKISSFD